MNKLTQEKSGALCINGVEIERVNGFEILSPEKEGMPATVLVSFDVYEFDVALGAPDFSPDVFAKIRLQ